MASKDAKKFVLSSFAATIHVKFREDRLHGKFLSEGNDVFVTSPNR